MSGTVVAVPMIAAPYELILKAMGNGNFSTPDVALTYDQELQENDTASSAYPDIACSTTTEPREHLFDKAVTPSDVGKLNRLVIPKQHAEKYFPLNDRSGRDKGKGVLLNFEDAIHKTWRFRYSYWNSSQSYVLTKGWSRYVKEKCLQAGDIVTFQRSCRSRRLFITFRRRPSHLLPYAATRPTFKRCPHAIYPFSAPPPLDIDSVALSSIPCVARSNPLVFLSALKSVSDDGQQSPFQVADIQGPSLSNNCNSYSSSVRLFGVNLQQPLLNLCAGITVEEDAKKRKAEAALPEALADSKRRF